MMIDLIGYAIFGLALAAIVVILERHIEARKNGRLPGYDDEV